MQVEQVWEETRSLFLIPASCNTKARQTTFKMCVYLLCVCTHCIVHVEVRGQLAGVHASMVLDAGLKLKVLRLGRKHLYPLSHPVNPLFGDLL